MWFKYIYIYISICIYITIINKIFFNLKEINLIVKKVLISLIITF